MYVSHIHVWLCYSRLRSLSLEEISLLSYMNWSTNFRSLSFNMDMPPPYLKHLNSILFASMQKPMLLAACSWLCSEHLTSAGVFARNPRSFALSASVIFSAEYHLRLTSLVCDNFYLLDPYMFVVRNLDSL